MRTGNPLARVVDAAAKGPERLVSAASLLPRVERLLSSAERLFVRLDLLLDKLEDREQQLGEVIGALYSTQQAMDRDVVPTMKTLQTVAPDLTELLAVSRALNELMGSLPGMGRAKKRVDEELEREREQ